jgi:hypothetical protein
MSVRDSSTTSVRSRADPLRDPDLGWGPFGYSRRKTKALLGLAASLIEELTNQIAQQQSKQSETEARLVEITAESEETRAKLEASRAELARLRAETEARTPDEIDNAVIGAALVSAHQAAAEIVAQARQTADGILAAARSDSTSIEEEANHVIEQAELRAHSLVEQAAQEAETLRAESERLSARIERERQLWTRFLQRALDAAGHPDAAQKLDETAEQPKTHEDGTEDSEVEEGALEAGGKDLEGELHGAIRATERP